MNCLRKLNGSKVASLCTLIIELVVAMVDVFVFSLFMLWIYNANSGYFWIQMLYTLVVLLMLGVYRWNKWFLCLFFTPTAYVFRKSYVGRMFGSAYSALIGMISVCAVVVLGGVITKGFCMRYASTAWVIASIVGSFILPRIKLYYDVVRLKYVLACSVYVEEFNSTPELFQNEIIDQRALDVYWKYKMLHLGNSLRSYM